MLLCRERSPALPWCTGGFVAVAVDGWNIHIGDLHGSDDRGKAVRRPVEGGQIVIALWPKCGTRTFRARIDLCEFLTKRLQFAFKPAVALGVRYRTEDAD